MFNGIREMLWRRKLKRQLHAFRRIMEVDGVLTERLTDDELLEQISEWAEQIGRVFKPMMLSVAQVTQSMKALGDTIVKLERASKEEVEVKECQR